MIKRKAEKREATTEDEKVREGNKEALGEGRRGGQQGK